LSAPLALGFVQRQVDTNRVQRVANQERLRVLNEFHSSEITIFSSHDPQEYDCCCGKTKLGV
jgi:hypothetical protein